MDKISLKGMRIIHTCIIYIYDIDGFQDYTEVITKCHKERPRVIKKCTVSKMFYYHDRIIQLQTMNH